MNIYCFIISASLPLRQARPHRSLTGAWRWREFRRQSFLPLASRSVVQAGYAVGRSLRCGRPMKHLFILAAIGIAAAFGWRHLNNLSVQTEQSRLNRSFAANTEQQQPIIPSLIDPSIPGKVVLRRQQVMKGFSARLKSINKLIEEGDTTRGEIAAVAAEIAARRAGPADAVPAEHQLQRRQGSKDACASGSMDRILQVSGLRRATSRRGRTSGARGDRVSRYAGALETIGVGWAKRLQ